MAGIINWKKAIIPAGNPDSDHSYVGIDQSDDRLYSKDDAGNVTKYPTQTQVDSDISQAISNHEALPDPHPQYQTSAESQAQVDAHANLTNNPHAVTKAQVGLGNVDNTSDINKPVSTATQSALNDKSGLQPATTQASATGTTTTASGSFVVMNSMSITPPAGTYLVMFSSSFSSNNNNSIGEFCIFSGGTEQTVSRRFVEPRVNAASGFGGQANLDIRQAGSTQCEVTVNGAEAIEVRWLRQNGTLTAYDRTLNIIRIYR